MPNPNLPEVKDPTNGKGWMTTGKLTPTGAQSDMTTTGVKPTLTTHSAIPMMTTEAAAVLVKGLNLLSSGNLNGDSILKSVAEVHPSLVAQVFKEAFDLADKENKGKEEASLSDQQAMDQEAISLIMNDQYVNAIKYVRQITGLGLKEAKVYCDNLKQKMMQHGDITVTSGDQNN